MTALLDVDGLALDVGGRMLVRDLALQVRRGEAWALLGANGSGKTTLLHALAGVHGTSGGTVRLDGTPLAELAPRRRARRVALLLQHSSRGFGATVTETVLTGRHPHLRTLAWEGPDDAAIADTAMGALGLRDLAGRSLDTLSGGELRRVEIARLLAQQAPLNLLDEPLNHLDLAAQARVLRALLGRCVGDDRGMLMAIHDLNLAYQACGHWLVLTGNGSWVAGPRDEIAQPALLRRIFGEQLEVVDGPTGPLFLNALHATR